MNHNCNAFIASITEIHVFKAKIDFFNSQEKFAFGSCRHYQCFSMSYAASNWLGTAMLLLHLLVKYTSLKLRKYVLSIATISLIRYSSIYSWFHFGRSNVTRKRGFAISILYMIVVWSFIWFSIVIYNGPNTLFGVCIVIYNG